MKTLAAIAAGVALYLAALWFAKRYSLLALAAAVVLIAMVL